MDVILTHEHTDFDALASLLGASKCFPKAVPVLPHQLNRNVAEFMALFGHRLPFKSADNLSTGRIREIILVDTQSFQPLKHTPSDVQVHVIDHHEVSPFMPHHWEFEGEVLGATSTLLIEKMQQRKVKLDSLEATLLLLGIKEDTGSLSYPHTTPRDALAVAWLLEQGADLEQAERFFNHPLSENQRALYQSLIEGSQNYRIKGHDILIAIAKPQHYIDEISSVAHLLRDLFDPAALFLLVDLGGHIQLVARSRSDSIDVGAITESLGGGGHLRAAAAVLHEPSLKNARERLVSAIERLITPALTVADVMSGTIQILNSKATVSEAAQAMLRYGYEGFPVTEDERLVGMIDRRVVDKAMHHGMGHLPIARLMHYSDSAVAPNDPIEQVQQIMLSEGWGQVPVVSSDRSRILGIVTRTDLIKLWGKQPQGIELPTKADISQRMAAALSTHTLDLLHLAGQTAAELGFQFYGVGGFVRDLLLQVPNLDLDLVVEGDAVRLAQHLTHEHGGRVITHSRFGTAKWLLPDGTALDFVTARTEFYSRPTALPEVTEGSIKLDLHRRDFTINTLAIRLDPENWGQLLDFYGGLRDLHEKRIRVLHSLSFIDDPTRILRAVRFEQRLGFHLGTRTEALIHDALDLMDSVSPTRIGHEIALILKEREPERYLARLDNLGVLDAIYRGLHWQTEWSSYFTDLRATLQANLTMLHPYQIREPWILYLALWLAALDDVREGVCQRLGLSSEQRTIILQTAQLYAQQEALSKLSQAAPSAVDAFLHSFNDAARLAMQVLSENSVGCKVLHDYQQELRWIEPAMTGNHLRELQIPPGPIYREILSTLRKMRLDKQIHTLDEERVLVEQLAQAHS